MVVIVVLCAVNSPKTVLDTVGDAFKEQTLGSICWLLGALIVFWVLKTATLVMYDKNYVSFAGNLRFMSRFTTRLHVRRARPPSRMR